MQRLGVFILLLFIVASTSAQHQNIPLNYIITQKVERNVLQGNDGYHTSIKPFNQAFLPESIYDPVFLDTNLFYYDLTLKIFKESLLNIHEKDVDLIFDPLVNFTTGRTFNNDSLSKISTNTRGFRVAGNITSKFSFETNFYETQVFYPEFLDSIADARNIAFGLGRSKSFKQRGHDVGTSGGMISYSPFKFLNLQFGHGKHFIGNGYRSLLLSDNAFNYPYLSLQASMLEGKLMYKNINAWMQTLDRRPASSTPEALFKSKNGSFRYLSYRPLKFLEVGLFEGLIYKSYNDSLGEVAVHPSFYVPVIGVASLSNKSIEENKTLLGVNFNLSIKKAIVAYGQIVLDDYNKLGYQLGAKWMDFAKIKNAWLQIEYNQAASYMYSNSINNIIQNYSHADQELAHPLGASFEELIFMLHHEYKRWFVTGKYFTAVKTRLGGDLFGENIFYGNDPITIMIAPEKVNWNYFGGEFGYVFNAKTKLQFFGGAYSRTENENNEWFFNFGLRTNLNNYYHEM